MVEVLHANGIYSSPIVTTIMIKAYDEKGPSVLKTETNFLLRHWYETAPQKVPESWDEMLPSWFQAAFLVFERVPEGGSAPKPSSAKPDFRRNRLVYLTDKQFSAACPPLSR
jgi:hypothetical protein